MVENEIVKVIIKMFAINFFVFICFFKIYNKKYEYIKMVIGSIIIAIIYTIEKQYINNDMFFVNCIYMVITKYIFDRSSKGKEKCNY